MEKKPYSAGAVKMSFWFMEFRKVVELLAAGKTLEEIKEMNKNENIFGALTAARANQIFVTVSGRIKTLDTSFVEVFQRSDVAMQKIFDLYKQSKMHPLIKSAIFHYEFEFIHPFADGNGRIGRMWHSLLLGKWNELFFWLPVEELIKDRQKDYYNALGKSDKDADSCSFVELILEIILDTIKETEVVG